jgi:hypothetical protein
VTYARDNLNLITVGVSMDKCVCGKERENKDIFCSSCRWFFDWYAKNMRIVVR